MSDFEVIHSGRTTVPPPDRREAFEAWVIDSGQANAGNLGRRENGAYLDPWVRERWEIWQEATRQAAGVPREPTTEMIDVGNQAWEHSTHNDDRALIEDIWRAMWDAART